MIANPEEIPFATRIGDYSILDLIGFGAFSVVRIARNVQTQRLCAVKIVPRDKVATPELEIRFETEIRVLQQMRHPNIVQLIDLKKDNSNYYIFMENCPNGELFQYIVNKKKLSEEEAKGFLFQIVDALKYCHSLGVVHRDMKPENILFDPENNLKITDFGFSRFSDPNGLVNTSCGSPCYASPEILMGIPYDGSKSDIWSTGIILYAMVTGQLPWTKKNQAQLFEQIKNGEYKIPNFLSSECQNLISSMICVDPSKRLSATQVLQHPFLHGVSDRLNQIKMNGLNMVSLHRLDQFFTRDISEPDFGLPPDSGGLNSARAQNFQKASKILTTFSKSGNLKRGKHGRAAVKTIFSNSMAVYTKIPPLKPERRSISVVKVVRK
ncbi:CAMK family protein kinase [Tritrichomonas foetus]|uniref:CAMK family protein kinase n=1 Tax=Tritrichomonas foetus TaxID=1144522 RepID=A0A1J4JHD7_9EUKA|nr:CAMK family protein kinase [Tritrichomonas foetus]|eukprot:OHS97671.1 CAMK family protein kinase [Tritrichomonas foetus]